MGVIKGSEDTLTCDNHHLDRHNYEQMSHRTYPTFSHQRAVVYALFEAYSKRKKSQGHVDSADRCVLAVYFSIHMLNNA